MRNVTLILDDGSRFSGKSFGYEMYFMQNRTTFMERLSERLTAICLPPWYA